MREITIIGVLLFGTHKGLGMSVNTEQAIQWYKKAELKNHVKATQNLVRLTEISKWYTWRESNPANWDFLGNSYYSKGNRERKNFFRAKCCYLEAISLGGCTHSEYRLGYIYHRGLDGNRDLMKAKKWYETAIKHGCSSSKIHLIELKKELLQIRGASFNNAKQWYDLGQKYYFGRNGESKDFASAKICYKKSLEYNPYAESEYSLGWMYHKGQATKIKLNKAVQYYQKAALKGHFYAKEELIKINEDIQTDKLYNQTSWWFSWGTSILSGPTQFAKKATISIMTPVIDFTADSLGQSWMKSTSRYCIEGIFLLSNPVGYTFDKACNHAAHYTADTVVKNLEIRDPYLRTSLKLTADFSGSCLSRAAQCVLNDSTSNIDEKRQEDLIKLEAILENHTPYILGRDGKVHTAPRTAEGLLKSMEYGHDVRFVNKKNEINSAQSQAELIQFFKPQEPILSKNPVNRLSSNDEPSHNVSSNEALSLSEMLDLSNTPEDAYWMSKAAYRGDPTKGNYIGPKADKHAPHLNPVDCVPLGGDGGINMVLFFNEKTNTYSVAVSGTHFLKRKHVKVTGPTMIGINPKAIEKLNKQLNKWMNERCITISLLTGHSEGGYLVTRCELAKQIPQVTFNAPRAKKNPLTCNLASKSDIASLGYPNIHRYHIVTDGGHGLSCFKRYVKSMPSFKEVFENINPKIQNPNVLQRAYRIFAR